MTVAILVVLLALLAVAVLILKLHKAMLEHVERIRQVEDMSFAKELRSRATLKASHRKLENEVERLGELTESLGAEARRYKAERNEARDVAAPGWGQGHYVHGWVDT